MTGAYVLVFNNGNGGKGNSQRDKEKDTHKGIMVIFQGMERSVVSKQIMNSDFYLL